MFRRLGEQQRWVNRDAVDAIEDAGDGTYTVTMRGGAVYPGISRQRLELAFPEFVPPPPPVEPIPWDPPVTPPDRFPIRPTAEEA
jgi:hypothetical protein